jgi:hypothetical protein
MKDPKRLLDARKKALNLNVFVESILFIEMKQAFQDSESNSFFENLIEAWKSLTIGCFSVNDLRLSDFARVSADDTGLVDIP